MRTPPRSISLWCPAYGLIIASALLVSGCGKSADSGAPTAGTLKPQQAATQLQQAFSSAPVEVKTTATAASEALKTANYEQAMQSLQKIKARKDLTLDQGMAVYNSEMTLEARLIAAMEAGDPNAKRAYEQLKRSKRN